MADITVGQIKDGKYIINNEEVSKEEYFRRKAEEQQAVREKYEAPTPGFEDLESFAAEVKSRRKPVAKKTGGAVKSASSRADGCAIRGKTRGKIV
jgi:hypothetical protein